MKCSSSNTIVENLYSKTFYYKIDENLKTILCLFLKINITYFDENTFYFIKPINFNTVIEFFNMSLSHRMNPKLKTVQSILIETNQES